jgi:hypothetical protein
MGTDLGRKRLLIGFVGLIVLAGAIQAWNGRNNVSADSIAYLDIADTYLESGFWAGINSYWSPLYSWLIALAFLIARPSPTWEFPFIHGMNFIVFLWSMFTFHLLLKEFKNVSGRDSALQHWPRWSWELFGCAIFFSSTLSTFALRLATPDLLAGSLVFLAAAFMLRISQSEANVLSWILLGATLGIAYLAKAVMLPVGIVFLLVALVLATRRMRLRNFGLSALAFGIIALPFIAALSISNGFVTTGEAGRLNHMFLVNQVPVLPWMGEASSDTRLINQPARFTQAARVYSYPYSKSVTYSPWYSPDYWSKGIEWTFSATKQMQAVVRNIAMLLRVVAYVQVPIVWTLCLLFIFCRKDSHVFREWRRYGSVTLPALVAIGAYVLIWVEGRYVFPFLAILWLSFAASINPSRSKTQPKAMAMFALMAIGIATAILLRQEILFFNNVAPLQAQHAKAATSLAAMGIHNRAKVAQLGSDLGPAWARLARLQVVAELLFAHEFWQATPEIQAQILDAFRRAGARSVITANPPNTRDRSWVRLADTEYYIKPL